MQQIYCKNCKHEWHWKESWWCCRKSKYENKSAGVTLQKRLLQECEQVNKNNDCLHYKKKWWKFWIK